MSAKPEDSTIADRRKAQVLDAAVKCFREYGFHASSMSRISAAAGMSSGHIYHYFKSKEDIVAAIVARHRDEAELLLRHAASARSPAEAASIMLDDFPEVIAKYTDPAYSSLSLEILAEATRNPRIAEIVQQADASVQAKIQAVHNEYSPAMKSKLEIMGALIDGLANRAIRNPNLDHDLDRDMLTRVADYILNVPD